MMCERCDAWEKVIGNWFGEQLLAKLEAFVEEKVEKQLGYLEAKHTQLVY
jgi:hypothetical protein